MYTFPKAMANVHEEPRVAIYSYPRRYNEVLE
jgi:hypothetical protein